MTPVGAANPAANASVLPARPSPPKTDNSREKDADEEFHAGEWEGSPPEIDLVEIAIQLGRRKRLVAKVMIAAVAAGLLLCAVLPARYTAVTRIMPPQQTQSAAAALMSQLNAGGGGALTAVAAKQLGIKNPNDIYLALLGSRPVADAVLRQFNLSALYGTRTMTDARDALARNTLIASGKEGLISVAVTDRDGARAAAIANAYIEQLRALTKTLAVTEASRRRLFYEEQLKLARESAAESEAAFQRIQQQNGLVQLDVQAKALIESLAALRSKAAAKQVEIDSERSYSTDRNPDVQLAERQLASLRAEAAALERRGRRDGDDLELGDVPGAGIEYLRAERELKYRQTVLDLLLRQYDAARLDEAQEAAVIQVVEPAIRPERSSAPRRTMILIVSSVAGLAAGCLLALGSWWCSSLSASPGRLARLREMRDALLGGAGTTA
jgi:uncharacterized protein involved in exopolysaccharide biosynthesis